MTAAEDREFVAEMREAQEAVLADDWTEGAEADASVADVLRLCDLAEKGLSVSDAASPAPRKAE